MTHIPVRDRDHRNGNYERLAPVVRLHQAFPAPSRRPCGWRLVALDVVFRVGLPLLAFVFVALAVVGLVFLITALGRAMRSLGGV